MLIHHINTTSSDVSEAVSLSTSVQGFPGALGAAKFITGGRGGQVIKITTLNATGAGSLFEALRTPGKRFIVFEVSGNIDLSSFTDSNSLVEICEANSDFTVLGQTAPEGGITITGGVIQMGGGWGAGCSNAPCYNAQWHYIRFRNTKFPNLSDQYLANGFVNTGGGSIVFNNCSFSWNNDQAISLKASYGAIVNVGVQRCIFSQNATNIIAGSGTDTELTGNVTFALNLFVNTKQRTPNCSGAKQYDIFNNMYFNVANRLVTINTLSPNVNFYTNYIEEGTHSTAGSVNKVQGVTPSIYSAGNYHNTLYTTPTEDNVTDSNLWKDFTTGDPVNPSFFKTSNFTWINGDEPPVKTAAQVKTTVLADVGANGYLSNDGTFNSYLDSYDTEKIADATNSVSRDPNDKTNWTLPTLPNNTKSGYDTAGDGIPDAWKTANGYTPATNYEGVNDPATGYDIIELYAWDFKT